MKLGYVILYVPDVKASAAFYEKAFGLSCRMQQVDGEMGYAELETGGTTLAFASESLAESHGFTFRQTSSQDRPPSVEIALVTDNVQASFDRALDAGAVALAAPTRQPWGQTVSYVRDADGYIVEICSPVKKPE